MIDAGRHPRINLMTYSEVLELKGRAGEFEAKVLKKPRYVTEQDCTGCGDCAEVCPQIVPNEFDQGMGARKAIYIPFPQAIPFVYTIDRDTCLNGTGNMIKCDHCYQACDKKAVNHEALPEIVEF